jgi:hypothetical protein
MSEKCVACWEEVLPDVANVVATTQAATDQAPTIMTALMMNTDILPIRGQQRRVMKRMKR